MILTPHARSRFSRANAASRARLAGDKHAKLRFLGARRAVCERRLLAMTVVLYEPSTLRVAQVELCSVDLSETQTDDTINN